MIRDEIHIGLTMCMSEYVQMRLDSEMDNHHRQGEMRARAHFSNFNDDASTSSCVCA